MLLSSFALEEFMTDRRGANRQSQLMPRFAKRIDEWALDRLKHHKETEELDTLQSSIPAEWQGAMNHIYHKGQRVAVRGISSRTSSTWCSAGFGDALVGGPDFMETIPLQRWDNTHYFDPAPDSYYYSKTFVNHGSFIDGLELFDNKFFALAPYEAKGMDPHQRQVLEVGYEALFRAAYDKKQLMNSIGAIYVGATMSDWIHTPKSEDAATAATGAATSITANRFSFCLGMKGPSLATDTESSASLTAVHLGCEAVVEKGRGVLNTFSLSGGVHIVLTPVYYPQLQAAGLLSQNGRCMPFDASAAGYGISDGCAFVVLKRLAETVDGQRVLIEGEPQVGVIAGSMMNSNGRTVSLSAPSGPAEQELVTEVLRNAGVWPSDVDCVECHGANGMISDAIEVSSLMRCLRPEGCEPHVLGLHSVRSNIANQIECGGVMSLIKALTSGGAGIMVPTVHVAQLNPHLDDVGEASSIITETIEYRMKTSYTGVHSKGFGGTNVHVLVNGSMDEDKMVSFGFQKQKPKDKEFVFWPGGGGVLESAAQPKRAYFIAGTFNRWESQEMRDEGEGLFSFVMVLGENRWEQFQVWLDGNSAKCLHPGQKYAPQCTPIQGPVAQSRDKSWLIDARSAWIPKPKGARPEIADQTGDETEGQLVEVGGPDRGEVGDTYIIFLRIAGKYRSIDWQKLDVSGSTGKVQGVKGSDADYYVASNWNGWTLEPMVAVSSSPGTFRYEVLLLRDRGEFQIVRNSDWDQAIYPSEPKADAQARILGPDGNQGRGTNWLLGGKAGDVFSIEFQRTLEDGSDKKKVSWKKERQEVLTEEQQAIAARPRFSVIGTWDDGTGQTEIRWTGQCYEFCLQVGARGIEGFQVLQDCDWGRIYHPSLPEAQPGDKHVVLGPYPLSRETVGMNWVIRAQPGDYFKVRVTVQGAHVRQVEWEPAGSRDLDSHGPVLKGQM